MSDKKKKQSSIERAMAKMLGRSGKKNAEPARVDEREPTLGDTAQPPSAVQGHSVNAQTDGPLRVIDKLKALNLLTVDQGRSLASNEYRRIKRPLIKNIDRAATEFANIVMVASALPDEGKSYSAISLAMSIAMERDRTVLLVDADVSKGDVAKLLQMEEGNGLIDYLSGDVGQLSEIIVNTEVPNLKIMPAGHYHPNATELLSSENMKSLVAELAARYPDRIVLFDSPPLLVANEAVILAGQVGQVLMVVAADCTSEKELAEALALIESNKSIGFLLNKCRTDSGSQYYSYDK